MTSFSFDFFQSICLVHFCPLSSYVLLTLPPLPFPSIPFCSFSFSHTMSYPFHYISPSTFFSSHFFLYFFLLVLFRTISTFFLILTISLFLSFSSAFILLFFSQFDRYQALLNNKKGPNFPLAITLAAEEQSDPSEVRTCVPHTVWKCHCSSVQEDKNRKYKCASAIFYFHQFLLVCFFSSFFYLQVAALLNLKEWKITLLLKDSMHRESDTFIEKSCTLVTYE